MRTSPPPPASLWGTVRTLSLRWTLYRVFSAGEYKIRPFDDFDANMASRYRCISMCSARANTWVRPPRMDIDAALSSMILAAACVVDGGAPTHLVSGRAGII
jgi:hypothetical protein